MSLAKIGLTLKTPPLSFTEFILGWNLFCLRMNFQTIVYLLNLLFIQLNSDGVRGGGRDHVLFLKYCFVVLNRGAG